MGNYKYNMAELTKIEDFNAAKALKNFKNSQTFFNKLTSFIDESQKFMRSFNPVVVIYNDEIRTDFAHSLKEMKHMLKQLELGFSDAELKALEETALTKDEKELSGKLRQFYSRLSLLSIRIKSARLETDNDDTITDEYDLSELSKIKELEASKASANFGSRKEYYSKLTLFIEDMKKFIGSYNPIVVLFSDDVRNEFLTELNRLKNERISLEMTLFDAGIKSLEDALSSGSEKVFSDGLTNLTAKMKILTDSLDGARNPLNTYDIDELSKIAELKIYKAPESKKTRLIYFDALTELSDGGYKILNTYNPIVVMYEDKMHDDFNNTLNRLKDILVRIEMRNAVGEIKNIEDALNSGDAKLFSDELLKFNARIEILAKKIIAARISKNETDEHNEKQAENRKEYIKKLNDFIKETNNFINSYNRKQDSCGKEACAEINRKLGEMKHIMTKLETVFVLN